MSTDESKTPAVEDVLVLVSGVSSFIGAHVARQLLQAGYRVRGTTRKVTPEREAKLRAAICKDLDGSKFELFAAELLNADVWTEAVKGCTYVQHIASPFALDQTEEALIKPAVQGTLNVLRAASEAGTVRRVVFTSSVASIYNGHKYVKGRVFTEKDWSVVEKCAPYPKSKVMAEKAAWKFVKELPEGKQIECVAVNPSFVMGPPLMKQGGESITHAANVISGKLPILPNVTYGIVDVRDVARVHIAAMTSPKANGQRYLACAKLGGIRETAASMQAVLGPHGWKIPQKHAPSAIFYLASVFDKQARSVRSRVDRYETYSSAKATAELGIKFTDPHRTLGDMAYALVQHGIVEDLSPGKRLSAGVAPPPVDA